MPKAKLASVRTPTHFPPEIERRRMISVPEAAELKGISEDTFRRHYRHLIKQLSPRRQGVTLGDVTD